MNQNYSANIGISTQPDQPAWKNRWATYLKTMGGAFGNAPIDVKDEVKIDLVRRGRAKKNLSI